MDNESYEQLLAKRIGGSSKEELLSLSSDLIFNLYGRDPYSTDDPFERAMIALENCRRLEKIRAAQDWVEMQAEKGDPKAKELWDEYMIYVEEQINAFREDDEDVSE